MNLPDSASVRRTSTDPTQRSARLVYHRPTDSIWRQRCENLLPSGFGILPVLGSVSEGVQKKQCCLIDEIFGIRSYVNDRESHFACLANGQVSAAAAHDRIGGRLVQRGLAGV
jgi:hypothetical protein